MVAPKGYFEGHWLQGHALSSLRLLWHLSRVRCVQTIPALCYLISLTSYLVSSALTAITASCERHCDHYRRCIISA